MRGAGKEVRASDARQDVDSNYYTALTVFLALTSIAACDSRSLSGMSALVEGVGKVGRHLLRLLDRSGAKVVGISTISGAFYEPGGIDVARLVSLAEQFGDECVGRYAGAPLAEARSLYQQPADILIPGARVYALDTEIVPSLKVRYVVPMANAPATPSAEHQMHAHGIRFLPGFIANSGGIFCWYLSRLPPETRKSLLEEAFCRRVRELVSEADRIGVPIADLARQQAGVRADKMKAERSGSLPGRLAGLARRLTPRRLPYLLLTKLLGPRWSARDTVFLRWYFNAKYFN
jgi:glutamate dehydrogenase/leucine dehydrogenase